MYAVRKDGSFYACPNQNALQAGETWQAEPPSETTSPMVTAQKQVLLGQMAALDAKKTRAITDALLNGDTTALRTLEGQMEALRIQLRVLPA